MFARVLIGVDGRGGGREAIALAKQLSAPNAAVTLVHVFADLSLIGRGGSLAAVAERARAEELLERERERASLEAQLVVTSDGPAGRGLHLLAERLWADLLVVGSSRRGPLGRVLMGDATRAALAGAPCAIAIASRGYRHAARVPRCLGVGYDGSPESELALATARKLAVAHGARIRALWVVSLDDVREETPIPADWPRGEDRLVLDATARLRQLGDDVEGDAVYGGPREELVRFAEELDLLVVGSRAYGPLGWLFQGSVSDYLARHAPCPLLVLPRSLVPAAEPGSAEHRNEESVPAGSRGV